jgi:hydrogenase nickel incorporation protein HypB
MCAICGCDGEAKPTMLDLQTGQRTPIEQPAHEHVHADGTVHSHPHDHAHTDGAVHSHPHDHDRAGSPSSSPARARSC